MKKTTKYILAAFVDAVVYTLMLCYILGSVGKVNVPLIEQVFLVVSVPLALAIMFVTAAWCINDCDKLAKPFVISLAQLSLGLNGFLGAAVLTMDQSGMSDTVFAMFELMYVLSIALMIFGGVLLITTVFSAALRRVKVKAA